MGRKGFPKKSKKIRRIPYIVVDGVENQYLDAALLKCVNGEALIYALSDELKIIKKAGITPAELKQEKYTTKQLIKMVSPHLLENYNFYNYLANKWDELQEQSLHKHFQDEFSHFALEEWDEKLRGLIAEDKMPIFAAVNVLRFYNNGELKGLIQSYLEEFYKKFHHETGLKMEGFEVDWEENIPEGAEGSTVEEEQVEMEFLEEDLQSRRPEETLRIASRLIENVAEKLTDLGDMVEFKELYEKEKGKVVELNAKLEEFTNEVKSKDTQAQALTKENRTLSKNVDKLNNKLEQLQKESGRMGLSLGEVRKQKDELEKTNANNERRLKSLEKDLESSNEKVRQDVKREFELKLALLRDDYEKQLLALENELEQKNADNENDQTNINSINNEVEKLTKELEKTKYDLRIVEKERNELLEEIENMRSTDKKDLETDDDDIMFGFNENDIEDFVEFENKPTKIND